MDRILAYKPAVRREIELAIAASQKPVVAYSSIKWGDDFLSRLKPFATAGKLLRGSLTCYSFEAFSGQPAPAGVRQVAAALEIIHSAFLIHDDIMDRDEVRRGQPSLYAQYRDTAQNIPLDAATHYGSSLAICGGDMAMLLSINLLAQADLEPGLRARAQQLFAETLTAVCIGQMQDMHLEAQPSMPAKSELLELIKTKTALYTVCLPLTAGALLAGQPNMTLQKLQVIGEAAGTIFQLRDDELGISGSSFQLGKPVGSDFANGKKTIAAYYLLKRSRGGDKRRLQALFGNSDQSEESIEFVKTCMQTYGIHEIIGAQIARLEKQAVRVIAGLPLSTDDKQELQSLVAFCAQRQS